MTRKTTTVLLCIVAVSLTGLLSACSTTTSTSSVKLSATDRWILLPFQNQSTTPMAGEKIASLLETRLRAKGVKQLQTYQDDSAVSLSTLLDDQAQYTKAANYARTSGYQYAVTGTVNEWGYKTGPDKEPTVGLTLKIVQLPAGQVIWQASGARTGWSYSNPSGLGDKVVNRLLKKVKISRSGSVRGQSVPVAGLAAAKPE